MATFFVADLFDLIFQIAQLVYGRQCKGIQTGAEKVAMELNCSSNEENSSSNEENSSSNEENSSRNGRGIFHQTELSEDGNCRSPLEDREMESLAASNNVRNENSRSDGLDDDGVKRSNEKSNDQEMVHFREVLSNTAQLTPEIVQTSMMCDLAPALDQKLNGNEESDQLELIDNGLVNGIDKMTIEENEDKLCANKDAVESVAEEDDNIVQEVIVNGHATTQDVTDKGLVQSISEFNANGKRRQSVADLKNMFESFSEDPSVDDELEDKLDGINHAHNGDFILDQKFDAFFESVNGCKDDNLDEDNPINSFVLKTPSKSQPPMVENESPIKLVLDMITPPPDANMDDVTEHENKDERERNKPDGNKPGKVTKSGKGKPTTPARKKNGVVNKESIDYAEKAKSPSKRPPGVGYDGRPLLTVKKASTPNMSSGTARPVAAPRRNSMPATTKQTPTANFIPATTKPTPTSRKLSVQNNQPNRTAAKKIETNPSTPKKISKNSSTPKKTATKSSVSNPTAVITSKTTCSETNPPSSSKPATTVSKPATSTKPSTATTKSSTATTKSSTATTKPSTATTKPSTATTKPSTAATKPSSATTKPSTATTKLSSATTKPSSATTKPSTATTKPSTATTKSSTTVTKPTSASTKSIDTKSTVKHKGVPFLPKKVSSAAPSTTATNGTKSTTNGTKSTYNGAKPTSNATKSTSKEAKPSTTNSKSKDNGSRPTTTNPSSKAKNTSSDPSSKSSNLITITNGRTMGKKASITDEKSETDDIAKHVIKKRNIPKTENMKQDKKGGMENKNYTIARDLIMDIVTKCI